MTVGALPLLERSTVYDSREVNLPSVAQSAAVHSER